MRNRRSVVRTALVAGLTFAIAVATGCGSDDDDGQDPSTFRLLGNMSAIAGASPSAAAPRPLWRRAAEVLVPRAIAQSVCAASMLEVCLETTAPDSSRVRECSAVDPDSCSFDVTLALFDGAQLFVRDVPSGDIAPFGGEIEPLANGCRLLLCDVTLDFDRQVASPAAVLNSCADPDAPFDCGFALSRTPAPGRGGGGGAGPPAGTPTPTLTPLPIQTAPPGSQPPPGPPPPAETAVPPPSETSGPVETPTTTPAETPEATPTGTPEPTPTETPEPTPTDDGQPTPTNTPDAGPTPTEGACTASGDGCSVGDECCSGMCTGGTCL